MAPLPKKIIITSASKTSNRMKNKLDNIFAKNVNILDKIRVHMNFVNILSPDGIIGKNIKR